MILDKTIKTPLYLQIYQYYKEAILHQDIKAKEKLPSIRSLSLKHSLSKTTIEKAYNQLLIEGYIESYPKSGYYVSSLSVLNQIKPTIAKKKVTQKAFINEFQDKNSFNIPLLKRCFQDVLHYQSDLLFKPLNPQGEQALKLEIHKHLIEERGVVCEADQIVIASGIQNQLMSIASLTSKRRVAYLVPLFIRAKQLFELLNFEMIPCHSIDEMLLVNPDFFYLSPSNLYPSGEVLPISARLKLIQYAEQSHAYIIEDDYNHIFRYNAALIPSIQGLSKGNHVIYIGSFSRNLLISMRISYMVLPPNLISAYQEKVKLAQTVSMVDQLALALFMKEGYYKKHLRKLSHDSKKHNEGIQAILERYPFNTDFVRISGLESNLHVLFKITNQTYFDTIKTRAKAQRIYIQTFEEMPHYILLPYSNIPLETFKSLLQNLFH